MPLVASPSLHAPSEEPEALEVAPEWVPFPADRWRLLGCVTMIVTQVHIGMDFAQPPQPPRALLPEASALWCSPQPQPKPWVGGAMRAMLRWWWASQELERCMARWPLAGL